MLELAARKRVTTSKRNFKFTDDAYLVIPAVNSTVDRAFMDEISHIDTQATNKNLKLNREPVGLGTEVPQRDPESRSPGRPQKLTTYFENNYRRRRLMRPLQ